MRHRYFALITLVAMLLGPTPFAHSQAHSDHETHDHEHHDPDEDNAPADSTRIEHDMAEIVGISTAEASSQTIRQTITSYGTLSTAPEQLSHVRARFSGLITSVDARIGDTVKAGDRLASVESNESLRKYVVNAPIAGTVIQRHANTGEVTQDQVLFSIANFDTLWAELRIYPAQRKSVSAGQSIEIVSDGQIIRGEISHIIPALDKPYQLARVKLDNRQLKLSPGLLVEGRIVTSEELVSIAVRKTGIQQMDGRSGVFVQSGETYQFSPLQLGAADSQHVEVLSGIAEGQRYVIENSYLIKADIEKSEAEHEH